MATIKVDVVSAEESIFSGDAELVSLPGKSGELGILPGHVPLITLIRPGFVRIHLPGKKEVEQVFVAGGVLEVQPDLVTVLADTAVRSNDLDEAKAAKALEDARAQRQNARSRDGRSGRSDRGNQEDSSAALSERCFCQKGWYCSNTALFLCSKSRKRRDAGQSAAGCRYDYLMRNQALENKGI